MSDEGKRPQDVGRRRSGYPAIGPVSPATVAVVERYRSMMRRELDRILDAMAQPATNLEAVEVRAKRWDLAIKLGRELGARTVGDPDLEAPATTSRGGAGAPRLTAKERKSLG
jgi:hypothetical protein